MTKAELQAAMANLTAEQLEALVFGERITEYSVRQRTLLEDVPSDVAGESSDRLTARASTPPGRLQVQL